MLGYIHCVCLDSSSSIRSGKGPMVTWLRKDLAANTQQWTIAVWHHPPYSKGKHDSDLEHELIQMRTNTVPVLEKAGVDLVLCGRSHSYERSFFLDGHYGSSSTLTPAMIKNGGSGREAGTGAYTKSGNGPVPHQGTVYAVVGCSGHTQPGPLNHPAMFVSKLGLGSLVIDITGNRLDARYLRETGAVDDYFTILKTGPY